MHGAELTQAGSREPSSRFATSGATTSGATTSGTATSGTATSGAAATQARAGIRQHIDRLIAIIDARMAAQVNAILHHPTFQSLEASWRGLAYLCAHTSDVANVKLKILPVSWKDLCRDLARAADFDQSRLFQLVYSEEFGTPGGEPYGLLLGDYCVSHRIDAGERTDDIAALRAIAGVCAAAFAPFVVAAHPALLGMDGFADLDLMTGLEGTFTGVEFVRWRSLRTQEDSRFLGIVAPRVLMRLPFRPFDRRRIDGFGFEESLSASGHGLLWGNAVYPLAWVVTRAYGRSGWFAELRGAPQDDDGGGLVTDLPTLSFLTDRPGLAAQPPVEVRLTGTQERQMAEHGLIPVGCVPYTPYLVFNANPSLHQPVRSLNVAANENARLAAMLQYVLCASRFAHYLKVMIREQIGQLKHAAAVEAMIAKWLARYQLGNDDASLELKARYPLRDASVEVREIPGRPGVLGCVLRLQPHFQLDDVAASFQLVAEVSTGTA